MRFITNLLASIGLGAASTGVQGCWYLFMDEPTMSNNLVSEQNYVRSDK